MGTNRLGKTSVCDIQHVKQIIVNPLPLSSMYVSMKKKLAKTIVENSSFVQHSVIDVLTLVVVKREKERWEQERKDFFAINQDGVHFNLKAIEFFLLLHYDYEKKENWFYLHLPEVFNRY